MSFLSRFFRQPSAPAAGRTTAGMDDALVLVPVPVPALAILLINLEKNKGAALTEQEVLAARDKAACMTLPLSQKRLMDEKRGYQDIDPENVWLEWQAFCAERARSNP
ncbi:hypothetical protein [Eleftheria terrae]|uniref:hypothetical protein n=1 Tax=Eleftheria terrae TaxID=1597781 RepID=UPI00263B70BB|nr:hypothetical protein [Eleftheria terrae]WKB56181.1 hypothetical protein N7L95_29515 [Eleftheria terrae]